MSTPANNRPFRSLAAVLWLLAALAGAGCSGDDDDSGVPGDDDDSGLPGDDDTSADDDDAGDDDAGDDDTSPDDDDAGDDDSAAVGELWTWCPGADVYVGLSTWTQSVEVSSGALYCASFSEFRTLEEEPSFKALLRVVPGTYPLPGEDGLATLGLPVCFQLPPGEEPPLQGGAGNVHSTHNVWQDTTYYSHLLEQPLETASGVAWWLSAVIRLESDTPGQSPPALVLDGSGGAPYGGPGAEFSLCPDDPQSCNDGRRFLACNPSEYALQRHRVTFDGGDLSFDVRMGVSMAATEPAAFVSASGTLDGESFAQSDYWKLIYNPTHHHFSRDFAVLFDSPIAGACGLKATDLDPWGDAPPARVHTIDCDLGELSERSVSAEVFEEIED
jgi:hypothetical protein